MMSKEKIYAGLANLGEVLVIVGAVIWITGTVMANIIFAAGATIFAIGRLNEKKEEGGVVLGRLYGQRTFGIVVLLLAAVVMNLHEGFYLGIYLRPSAWLLPFFVFVVIEVYTAFRIPSQIKKEKDSR